MTHQDWIGKLLLDRYRPVRVLAEGGQGVVYLARAEGGAGGFVRPVVVKRILPQQAENENNTRLFLREAKLLSEMSHSGILGIIDLAQVEGEYIMVLEYVRGSHVGRWAQYFRMHHGQVPWDFAGHVCAIVADALHHVHTRTDADGVPYDIVHRDVTPANILVDVSGAVKLADFGIARRAADKTEQISGADVVRGNFSFVSPEVFIGIRPTATADIYSLGMVLHWLVSGERTQKGENLNQTVYKALYVEPERLDIGRPEVPSEFADLVAEAVAKDPERRMPDAQAFSLRLRAMLPPDVSARFAKAVGADMVAEDFAVSARVPSLRELDASWRDYTPPAVTPSAPPPTAPQARRPKALWWGVGAAVAMGAAAGGVWVYSRLSAPTQPSEFILARGDVTATGDLIREAPLDTQGTVSSRGVDAGPTSDSASATPGQGVVPEEPAPSAQPSPGTAAATGTPPAEFSARVLTQAFAGRRGAVRRCAEQHLEVESLEVSIHFDADTDGSVRSASVGPAGVEGTPLGACLSSVARNTHFGPLPEPLSFTIPLTVRRE